MYSSSKLVTLLLFVHPQQELLRGEIVERLVGTDRVVGVFPGAQLLVQLGDQPGAGGDLIEILLVGALGAFDAAVEFGGAGRQDKQAQAALVAWMTQYSAATNAVGVKFSRRGSSTMKILVYKRNVG